MATEMWRRREEVYEVSPSAQRTLQAEEGSSYKSYEEKEVDMALDEMARSDEDTATVEANAPPRRSNRRKSVVATRSNGVVVDVVAAVLPEESATVEANSPPWRSNRRKSVAATRSNGVVVNMVATVLPEESEESSVELEQEAIPVASTDETDDEAFLQEESKESKTDETDDEEFVPEESEESSVELEQEAIPEHSTDETEDDEVLERVFTKRRSPSLCIHDDKKVLSTYQCLLRKQIQIFEAGPKDVVGVQGRINPIRLGQVGIRCRHCGSLTNKAQASGGGVYYSRTILGLYHLAQLMAKGHLENCKMVDAPTRAKLAKLRQSSKRSANGYQ
jgi:hypothetical protein